MCRQNPKISSWDTLDFVENQANFNNIRSWGTLLLSHFNQFCRLYTTSTCYTSAEIFILAHSSCRNVTSFFSCGTRKKQNFLSIFKKKKNLLNSAHCLALQPIFDGTLRALLIEIGTSISALHDVGTTWHFDRKAEKAQRTTAIQKRRLGQIPSLEIAVSYNNLASACSGSYYYSTTSYVIGN